MRKIVALIGIALAGVIGAGAAAAELISPEWGSDRILSLNHNGAAGAITFDFQMETIGGKTPDAIKSSSVVLARDFDEINTGLSHQIEDYAFCRVFNWNQSDTSFSNQSCYANPAFRQLELRNRQGLRAMAQAANFATKNRPDFLVPFWAEQELGTQAETSDPLVRKTLATETQWLLGSKIVARMSTSGFPFATTDRQRFARYLSRNLNLHPQIRQAIVDSGQLPSHIEIVHIGMGIETTQKITFSSIRHADVAYPLPPHLVSEIVARSEGASVEAKGLRQTLKAIAGTALPAKPSFEALLGQLRDTAKASKSIETALIFMEMTQYYGGAFMAEPAKMNQLRAFLPTIRPQLAAPQAAEYMQASAIASNTGAGPQREASAAFLAHAKNMDGLDFGTFRYVTFANIVRGSTDRDKWNKETSQAMPTIPDCYWTHIAVYPWASNAFKDLGDTYYMAFDAAKAWEAWDMGRAVDPDWQRSTMQSVSVFEANLRSAMPNNF